MEKTKLPYDQSHRIASLVFVLVVVSKGQGPSIETLLKKAGAYAVYSLHAKGTAPNDFYAVLGSGSLDKDVEISVIREDAWPGIKGVLQDRFSVSPLSAGLAFTVKLDSLAGVSIYKMLSNTRRFEHPVDSKKKRRKTRE